MTTRWRRGSKTFRSFENAGIFPLQTPVPMALAVKTPALRPSPADAMRAKVANAKAAGMAADGILADDEKQQVGLPADAERVSVGEESLYHL